MTRFKPGPGRDITDILFEVVFSEGGGSSGKCNIDDDEIEAELKLLIFANRGVADTSRQATFEFFIAIVDQDRNVVYRAGYRAARESFRAQVEFPGNQTRASYSEEFDLIIPKEPGQSADEFLIFIGFVLTPEELEYNRGRLRR